jgi:FkbM family methyltransferase
MTYRLPLPTRPDGTPAAAELDIIEGISTAVQRVLRRDGLAGYEATTMATLLTLFDQDERCVFLDIGANIGLYAELCAALFDPEAVVAFEPTPSTAGIARRIIASNSLPIVLVEAAVGETAGTAPLYLSAQSDASNSLVKGFKKATGAVDVRVVTIDDYMSEHGLAPTVMKIDVETHEPEVLRGARATIAQHRPAIVVEILHRRGHDHGPAIEEAVSGLGYTGYRLGARPGWRPRSRFKGKPNARHRDWLLVPQPLDPAFVERFEAWSKAVAVCTGDRNPRSPIGQSLVALTRSRGALAAAAHIIRLGLIRVSRPLRERRTGAE